MNSVTPTNFDAAAFLANAGLGRKTISVKPKERFFSQGDLADSVFYLQKGRVKISVLSIVGKEATITMLSAGDFIGEEALAAATGIRLATATAITSCSALRRKRRDDPCHTRRA
jgi:CRP/FNR family transcriptional regulator, cyclic AMP receptor protein